MTMTARNPNHAIDINFNTLNLTLYYQHRSLAEAASLLHLYQSFKAKNKIYYTFSGSKLKINNARWMRFLAAQKRGDVMLWFDATSSMRFTDSTTDSMIHIIHANCRIAVGSNGMILPRDKDNK
ncbi:uncharacterized protein [Rutidosis leptorrhynchoides]|uniref:uncharacterized protein n=1 Tax=Rutidosis leptorrhynchoides TaxID=125765 RepID=UPI003A9A2160